MYQTDIYICVHRYIPYLCAYKHSPHIRKLDVLEALKKIQVFLIYKEMSLNSMTKDIPSFLSTYKIKFILPAADDMHHYLSVSDIFLNATYSTVVNQLACHTVSPTWIMHKVVHVYYRPLKPITCTGRIDFNNNVIYAISANPQVNSRRSDHVDRILHVCYKSLKNK